MKLTNHSKERADERLGLNVKTFEKLAQKALLEGLTHSQAKGHLHKYLTRLYYQNKTVNNSRIYGEFVYLFSNERLVTVFQLPNSLKKLAIKLQSNKITL
jgi:hypothetical protein